jgi:hypothetical protein
MEGQVMSVAEQAKRVYESRLRAELEAKHRNRCVAIEPVSESNGTSAYGARIYGDATDL